MTSASVIYTFCGKVLPERASVTIPQVSYRLYQPDSGVDGTCIVSINLSQVTARFVAAQMVEDLLTLRNYIQDAIRMELDILGFVNGAGYGLEIT